MGKTKSPKQVKLTDHGIWAMVKAIHSLADISGLSLSPTYIRLMIGFEDNPFSISGSVMVSVNRDIFGGQTYHIEHYDLKAYLEDREFVAVFDVDEVNRDCMSIVPVGHIFL